MQDALRIIAAHERFIVVDKPAGLSFHGENDTAGVPQRVRDLLGGAPALAVHRLDRVTSGLLLLARDRAAASTLGAAFAERQIEKRYLAVSDRRPRQKQGWIRGGMVKSRNGCWKLSRDDGDPAVTWFASQSLPAEPGVAALRLFLLRPYTGRTHQLRVALKSIGSPILGDTAYGGTSAPRACLHAWRLAFDLDGQHWQFEAPPPPDLTLCAGLDEAGMTAALASWTTAVLPPGPI